MAADPTDPATDDSAADHLAASASAPSRDDRGPAPAALPGSFEVWRQLTAREDAFTDPRSVAEGGVLALREVTRETVRAVVRLSVAPEQGRRVAPTAVSIAEAGFVPHSWYRAIVVDDVPVGFASLIREPETDHAYLWRFLVDARYQGRGYGRAALERIVEELRLDPALRALKVSWVPEEGGPEPFYLAFGFEKTGEVDHGEVVGRLTL